MLIGVFWHAVSVIAPHGHFVYASSIHQSPWLYRLIYPEHIFRMEAFFLVSGFLAQMILSRKGKSEFMRARIKRVLMPLLLGCLGVNLMLQIFGVQFMGYRWADFDLWRWVMHGWFLITLLMCAGIDCLLPLQAYRRITIISAILVVSISWLGYVALVKYNADYWHLGGNGATAFNFFILHTVQYYGFYCFGAWLYHHQAWLMGLRQSLWGMIIGVAVLSASINYLGAMGIYRLFDGGRLLDFILYRANAIISALSIALLLFYAFYRHSGEASKTVRYLMHSAIVIYLVHHPLVIIFAWAFDTPALTNAAYYLLLVSATFAASYGLYEGIKRIAWLRFAFGLKSH